jgi:superfamily II DNA/RNA helicase
VDNIRQVIVKVANQAKKVDQLHDMLIKDEFEKVLIFGRTKWGVQKLSDELVSRGFRSGVIHGNKSQSQRQRTLDSFKRNEIKILLATDVAARGLDIPM